MKRMTAVLLCFLFLSGCDNSSPASPPPPVEDTTDVGDIEDVTPVTPEITPEASEEPINILGEVIDMLNNGEHQSPEGFDKEADGVPYGTLTELEYDSRTTGAMRKCYVYTPPNYDPDVIYPVLYLLHGIGGTHSEWLGGNPNEILSNLIASGELPPMIAVIPNVRAMQNDGYPADMLGQENIDAFDNFINDLRDDLMPFIKENYLISEKRDECAIAGLSMGGRESLFIGLSMPEVFGYIGAFSPAPGLLANNNSGQLTPKEMTLPEEFKNNTLIFICNGNQDGVVHDVPNDYHTALRDNGIKHVYYTINGGHDFNVWKNGLYYFAKGLFPKGDRE